MIRTTTHETLHGLNEDGFALLGAQIPRDSLQLLESIVGELPEDVWHRRRGAAYAVRDLHLKSALLGPFLSRCGIDSCAEVLVGRSPYLVSAVLFDKVAQANWTVPSHQDVVIPVACRMELNGYSGWSEREGLQYVSPPDAVLSTMTAFRVHLDECSSENGALEILPGTHRSRLTSREIGRLPPESFISCPARAGDVLCMKPLVVHKSRSSRDPGHRRVLHLVYADATFPDELRRL